MTPTRCRLTPGDTSVALSAVPCFNEEPVLAELIARLSNACRQAAGDRYEIVLVNDRSDDGTWFTIRRFAEGDTQIVGVNLSRNHGPPNWR
jgi:dolichol-phosphate mannosyltransferase